MTDENGSRIVALVPILVAIDLSRNEGASAEAVISDTLQSLLTDAMQKFNFGEGLLVDWQYEHGKIVYTGARVQDMEQYEEGEAFNGANQELRSMVMEVLALEVDKHSQERMWRGRITKAVQELPTEKITEKVLRAQEQASGALIDYSILDDKAYINLAGWYPATGRTNPPDIQIKSFRSEKALDHNLEIMVRRLNEGPAD